MCKKTITNYTVINKGLGRWSFFSSNQLFIESQLLGSTLLSYANPQNTTLLVF